MKAEIQQNGVIVLIAENDEDNSALEYWQPFDVNGISNKIDYDRKIHKPKLGFAITFIYKRS